MSDELRFRIVDRSNHSEGRGLLLLECERGVYHGGSKRECAFSLGPGPARNHTWQWDGDKAAPTIQPSINCQGGCGRHFTMTKGQP